MGVRWDREREGAQSYDGQNAFSSIIQYITYSLEFTVIYFRYRSGSLIIIIIIIIINNTTGSSTVNCSIQLSRAGLTLISPLCKRKETKSFRIFCTQQKYVTASNLLNFRLCISKESPLKSIGLK